MRVSITSVLYLAHFLQHSFGAEKLPINVGVVFPATSFGGRAYSKTVMSHTNQLNRNSFFSKFYTLEAKVNFFNPKRVDKPYVAYVLDLLCNTMIGQNVSVIIFMSSSAEYEEEMKITQYLYHLNSFTGIPILAWNAENSGILVNKDLNQYRLLQMAPSLESQVNAMMAIMKRYSWKKFAVVTSTIPGHKEFVSLCRKYASDITNKPFNFEVVSTVVVSDARSETSVRDALKTVDSDVRIFFLYATQKDAALILAEAKWLGIADKNYLWIGTQSVVGVKMATESDSYPVGMLAIYFQVDAIAEESQMFSNPLMIQTKNALTILTTALDNMIKEDRTKLRDLRSNASCETDFNYVWREGDELHRYLKAVSTSKGEVLDAQKNSIKFRLEFNDEGYLKHPYLIILNLNEDRNWVDIGDFTGETLKINDITWPGGSTSPPTGKPDKFHLKVVTLNEPPFVIPESGFDPITGKCPSNKAVPCQWVPVANGSSVENGTEIRCCTGYCIDLLNQLAEDMGFDFELYRVKDGKWGARSCVNNSGTLQSLEVCDKPDQVWNGLVKDLVDSKADLCMTALKINSEREEALDMSLPFLETGISISVAIRRGGLSPTAFLEPFDTNTWLLVLIASIQLAAMAIFMFEWLSPQSYDMNKYPRPGHKFSLFRVFWLVWATLFSASVSTDVPRSHTSRFMALVWAAFSMTFYAVYTANLAAFMITRVQFHDISGINDRRLVNPSDGNERFKFGTVRSGNTYVTLKKNYYEVHKNMEPFNTEDWSTGIEALKTGELDAFIYDAVVLDYLAGKDNNCQLLNIGKWFAKSGYAVGLKKGSKHTDKVNFHLLQYQQRGVLERLQNFWFTGVCSADSINKKGDSVPLGVINFMSAFILLSGGTVLCLFILCFEYFYCRYIRPKLSKSKGAGWCSLLSLSMAKSLSFSEAVIHLHKRHKENQRRNVLLKSRREETLERMLMEANTELVKLAGTKISEAKEIPIDGGNTRKRRAFNNLYVPIKPYESSHIEKESVL